ncbi:protein FAM184A isoform X2 [Ambystoma mexicanum]|uniref:protein FAM184A isoform X2 n=1 Tax=Ambystoma mexicanum TaxID=8296 RepID=UPI0037E8ACAC
MATGMSWHHYYSGGANVAGRFSAASAAPQHQHGGSLEYSAELHLKMSKKIAQLTKVIYALNTRNDEHESGIQAIKEAHEEEIQQILAETREKILQYKSKVTEEVDLKRRIQGLEESLEEHKKMKQQALAEFEAFKGRVEDMQLCAEAQHVQRVVTMSREVEEIRKRFEERLRGFMQTQLQCEKDKRSALEDLRVTHRLEIQEILKTQNACLSKGQETLEEMHRRQMEDMNCKLEDLRLERKQLVEDYEGKLSKAQDFYEHELEALKRSQMYTADSLHACMQKETEMRREFQSQEAVLQNNLGKLKAEFQIVQKEAESLKEKCDQLQIFLNTAENNVQVLRKQLEEVKQEESSMLGKHQEVEMELAAARDRLQQQATELVLKASHIGLLQATQMTQEVTIRDLESEKSRIKEKISRLEEERTLLQNQNQNLDERQRQQILALEKRIHEAKLSQQEYYEKEIKNMRIKYEEEAEQFKEAQARALEELSKKHQFALANAESTASKEKKMLQNEIQQHFEKEKMILEEEKNRLQQQMEKIREELTSKLTSSNQEIARLQDLVKNNNQDLGSAERHISSLKESQEKLEEDLNRTRATLRETSDSLLSIQKELEKERQQHEAMLCTTREEEKFKVDKIARDLELKWTENLRQECNRLREELKLQHEEDKKSAMNQIMQLKEREITAARDGWQKKVEDLLDQISLLKQNLEMQLCQSQTSLQQLNAQFSQERQRLTRELQEREEEHQQRQKSLQEAHLMAFQNLEGSKSLEQKDLEERLQQRHVEELQSVKDAHRQLMESLRSEMEQEHQTLRFELEDEGKAMLASLRSELNHQHAASIDQLRHNHQQEMAAATMEVERGIEVSRRQEKEYVAQLSNLQDDLRHRDRHIAELEKEVMKQHENISALTKELEFKGKEILRIRSEANQQMRLEEMEEKYQNREPRPEDLQLIAELKDMIAERDQLIKKLIDDKKFYQLELVNRETNFNKVFNASPNVGVINPLVKQKKKNDKSTNRFVSVPNLSALENSAMGNGHPTRLEPIPNSPIHDIEFSSSKPLPQPMPPKEPKTFMSHHQTDASPVTSSDPQHQEWFARYFTF